MRGTVVRKHRILIISTLAVAVAPVLAGCASSGTVAGGGSGPGPTAPHTSASGPATGGPATSAASSAVAPTSDAATSAAPSSTAWTGTKLKGLFPGNAALPAGWKRDEQSAIDSGDSNRDSPGDPLHDKSDCVELTNTSSQSLELDYKVSDAELDLNAPEGNPYFKANLAAAGYLTGDGAKQIALMKSYMARCKTFTTHDMASNAPVPETVSIAPVPGIGDEAYDVKIIPGKADYFSFEMIMSRVGDVVFGADANWSHGAAPTDTLKKLVTGMATQAKKG